MRAAGGLSGALKILRIALKLMMLLHCKRSGEIALVAMQEVGLMGGKKWSSL
jgi:hypothetical protein